MSFYVILQNGHEKWLTHLLWSQVINMEVTPALLVGVTLYVAPQGSLEGLRLFDVCKEVIPTLFATTNSMWHVSADRFVVYILWL